MWSFCIWIGRMQKWICFGLVTTSDDVQLFVDAIRRELYHAQINCLLSSVFWTRLVSHWTLHLCPPESGVGCRRLVQLCSGAAAAYCTSRTESRSLSGSDTCPTSIFWADWVGFCVTDAGNTVTTRLNSFMSGWYLPKWFIILSTIATSLQLQLRVWARLNTTAYYPDQRTENTVISFMGWYSMMLRVEWLLGWRKRGMRLESCFWKQRGSYLLLEHPLRLLPLQSPATEKEVCNFNILLSSSLASHLSRVFCVYVAHDRQWACFFCTELCFIC